MFVALMNSVALLGSKDRPTKAEVVAYNQLLEYAGSIARFNRLLIEEEIERKLDAAAPNDTRDRERAATRVA